MHFLAFFVCSFCPLSLNLCCYHFHFVFRNRILTNWKQELVIQNCQWNCITEKVYRDACLQIKRIKASMPVMTQISTIQLSLYPFCLLFQCLFWRKWHSEIERPLQIGRYPVRIRIGSAKFWDPTSLQGSRWASSQIILSAVISTGWVRQPS